MKKLFSLLLVLVFILSLAACTDVTPEKIGEKNGNDSTESDVPASNPETSEAPKTEVFKIGDIVQAGDVTFTVNGVREVPGTEFLKPKEGNIWYAVDITVENKSSEAVQMSSLMMFSIVDSEGYSHDLALGAEVKGSLDGELSPGRKKSGELAYEIPKEAKGLELEIDPTLWGNGKIIVKLDR